MPLDGGEAGLELLALVLGLRHQRLAVFFQALLAQPYQLQRGLAAGIDLLLLPAKLVVGLSLFLPLRGFRVLPLRFDIDHSLQFPWQMRPFEFPDGAYSPVIGAEH